MEVKSNQSTDLRPEGARILDAPLVPIDLNDFKTQIKQETAWESGDRNAMTVYKTDKMRIVLVALHKEAILTKHKAEGIISVQVLEGEIDFSTKEQTVRVKQGNMLTLHRGIPHWITAIEESVFLLTVTR